MKKERKKMNEDIYKKILDAIAEMDRFGFFIHNGTFGLEKRDDLIELVKKAEDMYNESKKQWIAIG